MSTAGDVLTSRSHSDLRQELIDNSEDKGYRHAYADENLNISIATQIKVLREQREMRQEDLAREAEMKQPMISRYENVNYSSWSINTLKRLAWAFDVWLDVRFRSFGELVTTVEGFNRESLQVPKFDEDLFFKQVPGAAVAVAQAAIEPKYLDIAALNVKWSEADFMPLKTHDFWSQFNRFNVAASMDELLRLAPRETRSITPAVIESARAA